MRIEMSSTAFVSTTLIPTSAQLHHRCHFDIAPNGDPSTAWAEIVKTVRSWLIYKLRTNEQLLGAWLFTGGVWNGSKSARVTVSTDCEKGEGSSGPPQFWSLRHEHPCEEYPVRQWRVDIGLTSMSDRFRFSISASYWIVPGYIGPEPPSPVPTAPSVIGSILRKKQWRCSSGAEVLYQTPTIVRNGDGRILLERLEAPGRMCPIVLISCSDSDGRPMLDADALAKALAGSARVYVAESPVVMEEWEYFLPRGFRCQNGMVRIYQPGVQFDSDRDAKRHRYFSEEQIQELSERTIREMIVRGVARRANATGYLDITSLEDIETRRREIRLREIKHAADDRSKIEWIELLERDNQGLQAKVRELSDQLQASVGRAEDLEDQNIDLSKEIARLNYLVQELGQKHAAAAESARLAVSRVEAINRLTRLPGTVREVAEAIQGLFPEQILFTPRGLASTEDRSEVMVKPAWECLWAMANSMHSMFFAEDTQGVDFERRFKELSGFDLGMTEGKSTKKDKKFMNLRRDLYDGKTVEFLPHVKVGNKEPRLLRVHFYLDYDRKIIVIGHCGGHLDNFSTRNQ
jgi:hypothetical protein